MDEPEKDGVIKDIEVTNINKQLGDAEKQMWMQFVNDAAISADGAHGHKNGKIYKA